MLKGLLILVVLFILIVIAYLSYIQHKQTTAYQGPISSHFNGKTFFNLTPFKGHTFADMLRWRLHDKENVKWPSHVENTFHPNLTPPAANEINVTFVNHSTMLIQTPQLTLLTDPVWSERVSPFSWYGPKRVRAPGIAFANLPKIDLVIISHSHYDHLDLASLIMLNKKFHPVFLVPLGDKNLLTRNGISNVTEMDWFDTYKINNAVITFLPTQHWSARWLNDRNKTLWGSYGIALQNYKIYFAGDSGYSSNFKLIKEKWGSPDLAFLSIGAYLPRWFMRDSHMDPTEALQAHIDLGAKESIAIHFGTFKLSDEGIDQPVVDLQNALEKKPEYKNKFIVLGVGESKLIHMQ